MLYPTIRNRLFTAPRCSTSPTCSPSCGRRLGRTVLTALGLGIGVGLVVTVTALSNGLDRAQAQVLEPLTGVGTDMSVSRPIEFSDAGNGPFQQLSDEEREQLRRENGGGRFGLQNLGDPGEKFSRDTFVSNGAALDAGL